MKHKINQTIAQDRNTALNYPRRTVKSVVYSAKPNSALHMVFISQKGYLHGEVSIFGLL